MRIISWNVNGLRAVERKGEIQKLIETYTPDILLLQEIKGKIEQFSPYLQHPEQYTPYYNSAQKAGYAGTGIWIKNTLHPENLNIMTDFPNNPNSDEGRIVHVEISGSQGLFDILGVYFPNGGKSPEAWKKKLVFYKEFSHYIDTLRAAEHGVLWGGDINCAHQAIDLARPKENDGKIGFHPLERAWLDERIQSGWYDIWRAKNPDAREVYSWWDVITKARARNVGWRLDSFWGDARLYAHSSSIQYLQEQIGSDHCPILIEVHY